MSRLQSTRRMALSAGSSLALAVALSIGSAGLVLSPTAALAYDECTPTPSTSTGTDGVNGVSDPTINDPGLITRNADSFTCASASYASGVTYTSQGALTVLTSGTGTMATNAGGVNLTGLLGDNVTFVATKTITGTDGPAIDVTAVTGAIDISAAAITANTGTASGAIRALSTGGPITVTTTGTVNANSNTVTTGDTAIEARATGGTGAVTVTTSGNVTGRQRGIYAQSGGALTVTTSGNVALNTTLTGVGQIAAIDAVTTGTGAMILNVNAGSVTGTAGRAIRASSSGTATINIAAGRVISAGVGSGEGVTDATPLHWVMDLSIAPTRTMTLNNAGTIRSNGTANSIGYDDKAILGAGGGRMVINNSGSIIGRADFSGLASITFNNTSSGGSPGMGWHTTGDNLFTPGADVLTTSATGAIYTSAGGVLNPRVTGPGGFILGTVVVTPPAGGLATTFDFGAGVDAFNNNGILVAGEGNCSVNSVTDISQPACDTTETVTTFIGLEAFNTSGLILLGSIYVENQTFPGANLSDRQSNDRLVLAGTPFVATGASRIEMDVNYGGLIGQASCTGSTAPSSNFLAAADCVDIRGGSTSGTTLLTLRSTYLGLVNSSSSGQPFQPALRGAYYPDGIVLIDVNGGVSHAGDFVLDPNSEYYSARHGGVIDEGLFIYALTYDESDQRHKLASFPSGARELGYMAGTAQDLWRGSNSMVFDRQAELRDGLAGPASEGGLWLRTSAQSAKRTPVGALDAFGRPVDYDDSFQQDSYTITSGVDLLGEQGNDHGYALGVSLGYAHADVAFANSSNSAELNGFTGGVYASYAAGDFFLDTAFNASGMVLTSEIPALGFGSGKVLDTNVVSLGVQAEAGWRAGLWTGAFVEPLASFSYVSTAFDDLLVPPSVDPTAVPGNTVEWDDTASLRGAVGARIGLDYAYGPVDVRYSLIGRVWNEFAAESELVVRNNGPDAVVTDDFSGTLGELGGSVSLANGAGTVTGFLSAGGTFREDYRSAHLSAGFRYRW